MYNSSPGLRVWDSTLAGNQGQRGGGVLNVGSAWCVNVTFSQNVADSDGGGFYNNRDKVAELSFVTFYYNSAGARGGQIYDDLGLGRIKNSLLLGDGSLANCDGFLPRVDATTAPTPPAAE
ncbi:MAG: hypothetical protein N3C12_07290 [Candidatus Binatia bacterium]|nr:hypothetical protein [Candidatus Binatia bacterium]